MSALRVMAALKAARDFGLDAAVAAEIARRARGAEHVADALARALLEGGAIRVPDSA
jgi:hypothetical protein